MVRIIRTEDSLAHTGKKGMKWGYNDGSRNGRRTAAELKDIAKAVAEYQKNNTDKDSQGSGDVEGDYHEANNMLKYLGITLDLQSDDKKVAETMAIYNQMKNTKDNYQSQHEWLKAFSKKLAKAGYDMAAVDKMLDEKKDDLNKMNTGTGTGNREKSNQDWKENDAKKTTNKSSSSSKKNSSKTSETSSSTSTKKESTSTAQKATVTDDDKTTTTKKTSTPKKSTTKSSDKSYSYRPKNTYKTSSTSKYKYYPSRSKVVKHDEINQNGDYLEHHGILGQRWGVRRYQNSDGSLTSEGKKRYGYKTMSDSELRDAVNRKRLENRYKELKTGRGTNVSRSIESATGKAGQLAKAQYGDKNTKTKTVNAAGNVVKDAGKIVDKATETKIKADRNKIDTSKLSKEDLQKAINRMELEKEYEKLSKSEIERGKILTTDALQNIGLVASTAVDVVTLAVLLDKVMHK